MHQAQKRLSLRLALCAGAIACLPATGFAQDGSAIEEVVVTARKRSENLQSVPVAVTAISAEAIKNQSIESIRDITNQTPSLLVNQGSSGRNSLVVTIRGQTNNDLLLTVDPAVGIYIDGVSLAKTITGELANLTDVDHVEVLKGPQGTLYGRNTTGGSLNIFTRLPTGELGGEITLRTGNFGRYGGAVIANLPLKGDDLALRIVGNYDKRDPWGKNVYSGKGAGGDLDGGTLRGTLLARPADKVEVLIRGDYTKSTTTSIPHKSRGLIPTSAAATTFVPRETGVPGGAAGAAAYAGANANLGFWDTNFNYDSKEHTYSWGTSATVNVDLTADMAFKAISAYRVADRDTFYDLDGSPFNILHTHGYTHQEIVSHEAQLTGKALDGRLNWIVGGYYSREFGFDGTQSVSLGAAATRSFNEGHVVNKSAAGFTQASFDLTDQFSVTGGLRYTHESKHLTSANRRLDGVCNLPVALRQPGQCLVFRDASWNKLNYLLSADYKPADGVLVYVSTSTGFRSGGHNLRGGIDPTTFQTFNPENVKNYELGLKADWLDHRLRTNFAAYYTDYKNIQRVILVASTLNPTSTVVGNAASAKVQGLEAEIVARPIENLTLTATGALTDPKYKVYRDGLGTDFSGQPFVFIPKKTYSLSAAYNIPIEAGDLRLQADWSWRGRVFYNADSQFNGSTAARPDYRGQAAFGLLNARASVKLDDGGLEMAFFGKNLLNKKYSAFLLDTTNTALGFVTYVPGDRRTWGFEVTKTFP